MQLEYLKRKSDNPLASSYICAIHVWSIDTCVGVQNNAICLGEQTALMNYVQRYGRSAYSSPVQ